MLTLKSFLEKRKVKKMVDDFGGPIKVKKVGPTEPKLYGKLTKSRLNTYSRETYSDSLNQRIHTAISQEIKTKEIINLERQKFISGLVFNLNLAPMVDLDTLSHLGSVSIETFGKTKTISSREFEKKFPEKYLEAQVGYIIMKFIFDSSDRNISRDVNVKFYNNGEYILFDFEGVENFFLT